MVKSKALVENMSSDSVWFKDAIIYEVHVRCFCDSDNDGIGDFQGLKTKLPYIQDLGVNTIWLLPFYPSPLKDEGYDISDYNSVNPLYGTLDDFIEFLDDAHSRGIRVITELVLNHTSDQHEWFKKSRRAKSKDDPYKDFYVWSENPEKYEGTRIIFKDFEISNWTYDPVANAYYWHRFYSHQPDLNFDNPLVQKAMFDIVDFWFSLGVDGLRLDAVPYLFEREGSNCENLPETHEFLKKIRKFVDSKFENKLLLAEANQWPEDAIAYFGNGDECQMNFHFPLMPRLYMACAIEDREPIIDILEQTPDLPENCQWGIFLRNHDELTLEMVTDHERDYMYRTYAIEKRARLNLGIRRRLAPLMENNKRKIELMNVLLMSLPGTPIIYYGDEIGMGDNIYLNDRDGVRTPMQWNPDRNGGFSKCSPHQLYLPCITEPLYHYTSLNAELQSSNPSSLLNWMKDLMYFRRRHYSFSRGNLRFLNSDNKRVISFIRKFENEEILVVANLSTHSQYVKLDLSSYAGEIPLEIFGQQPFLRITKRPYKITLSPWGYFWLLLKKVEQTIDTTIDGLPTISLNGDIQDVFNTATRNSIEEILPHFLNKCRWYAGKSKIIKRVQFKEIAKGLNKGTYLSFISVKYNEGFNDLYFIPMAIQNVKDFEFDYEKQTHICLIQDSDSNQTWVLFDFSVHPDYQKTLLNYFFTNRKQRGIHGGFSGSVTQTELELEILDTLQPKRLSLEQSNTTIAYDDKFILKIFRKLDEGENPDVETTKFLTENSDFKHVPRFIGAHQYRARVSEPFTIQTLTEFIPNQGNAWEYTLNELDDFLTQVHSQKPPLIYPTIHRLNKFKLPKVLSSYHLGYIESIKQLGKITGQMHICLASGDSGSNFTGESFSIFDKRSLYQSLRTSIRSTLSHLKEIKDKLPPSIIPYAKKIIHKEWALLAKNSVLLSESINCKNIRTHGDFHLGQILYTGSDFYIIDFEGEPSKSISERKLKRPALRDVAGILRSFQYAAETGLQLAIKTHSDHTHLAKWAIFWERWISAIFCHSYLNEVKGASFMPKTDKEINLLLDSYVLEKTLYEIDYELNNRPDWLPVPIKGLFHLLEGRGYDL